MPIKRPQLERQLTIAREALQAWEAKLDERGCAPEARRREPKWRQLNATCTQLASRLRAVEATESREQEALSRKAAKSEAAE